MSELTDAEYGGLPWDRTHRAERPMSEQVPSDQTSLLGTILARVLDAHRPIADVRDEVKSCRCGLLFGIQHLANGDHSGHLVSEFERAVAEDEGLIAAITTLLKTLRGGS